MSGITPAQLRKIHALSRERGLDDESLHNVCYALTKKDSLKKLTIREAIALIDSLTGHKVSTDGRMTDSQRKYIFGLLKEVGWTDDEGQPSQERFMGFVREKFKVEKEQWITKTIASNIIEALKAMKERREAEAAI